MSDIWEDETLLPDETGLPEAASELRTYSQLGQEVLGRIQRAKLYETLLSHNLFGEGSASPEIIEMVESEIKTFVVERIEVLMGMRQPVVAASSEFSPEETKALKVLAGRVLAKTPAEKLPEPVMQQPAAPSEPSIRVVQPKVRPPAQGPSRSVQVGAPVKPPPAPRRRRSNNVSQTGQDLSQAGNPAAVPMPSNDAANAHIAASAFKVMSSGKAMMGNGAAEGLNLNNILPVVQANNKGE